MDFRLEQLHRSRIKRDLKIAKYNKVLKQARVKADVIATSEYYEVFGSKQEQERDLNDIFQVIKRLKKRIQFLKLNKN
jgi:hypothetical protein